MPPIRTTSIVKPQKTERTHEENQERAYIAASRRSDRSLEARIESARRASEIHKKRTGRALRVTEQDVINEEMYEEEDDLPASYRRFAQHLQHNHLFLDEKFTSYMIANVATREAMLSQYWASRGLGNPVAPQNYSMMGQNPPITGQVAPMLGQTFNGRPMSQQYVNPPHFAYQNVQPSAAPPVQAKQEAQPPSTYRQPLYPPQKNQFVHQRSASIATPQSSAYPANIHIMSPAGESPSEEQRRMSLPTQPFQNTSLTSPTNKATSQQQSADQIPFNLQPCVFDSTVQDMNFGPLSASLPLDQQQIVGTALSPTNPSTQFLMAGSEGMPQPFSYNYDLNGPLKPADMNQILTSNSLEITPAAEANPTFTATYSQPSASTADSLQIPTWPPNQCSFGFGDGLSDFKSLDANPLFNNTPAGATQTPNSFDFSSYININESGELGA